MFAINMTKFQSLQIDSTGFHTKDQTSKLICTQVKPKSSTTAAKPTIKLAPREQSISKTTHQSHIKGQNERVLVILFKFDIKSYFHITT